MIYFIVNNDFHIDNLKNYYNLEKSNITLISVPYNLKSNKKEIFTKEIIIPTPFRESRLFWNPFNFYKAKKRINKINFSESDQVIFQTEYDPLNQYIIYTAKKRGAKTILLEEGIATYYTFINSNSKRLNMFEIIKLFYFHVVLGFYFIKFLKLGNKVFLQMDDQYIDEVLFYFDIPIDRNIQKYIIDSNQLLINDLDKNSTIFLNQPLYESYLPISVYLDSIVKILTNILKKHNIVYFKFHPRDKDEVKKYFRNNSNLSNVIYIDNIDLIESVKKYKPMYAYSIFSDSLFKLYHYGLTSIFLYSEIAELNQDEVLINVDKVLKSIKNQKIKMDAI